MQLEKRENEWADWIEKKGGSVEVRIKLLGDGARPTKIEVEYFLIDAKGSKSSKRGGIFENAPNQYFNRLYFD